MLQAVSLNTTLAQGAAQVTAASGAQVAVQAAFAADPALAAGVMRMADADCAERMARIWKGPETYYKGIPIGDAKFGGVSLGMPGGDASKVVFDPKTHVSMVEPGPAAERAVGDPKAEGAPDSLRADGVIPTVVAILIGGTIAWGLYANYVDSRIAGKMKWVTDILDRRRGADLDRARAGEDPFARSVAGLKERIRKGEDGESYLAGRNEMWDDSVRALIEVLVEGREKNIPMTSARTKRMNAIAEVRNLLRLESDQIFKSSWFPRVTEGSRFAFLGSRYDNVDELVGVARARLMTLEKAASANGKMDWPKAALEELRLIDPEKFA